MAAKEGPSEVTIQLRFRKRPHGTPVHFKSDGDRFDCERTMKFNVSSKYTTEITIKPVLSIEKCLINGNDQRLLLKQLEDGFVMYKTEWQTTDVNKTKKGSRQKVPFNIELKKFGEVPFSLQCKFYPEKEKHHTCWGPVCGQVEFKCVRTENNYINVTENILI